jgi:hypothetical protein
VKYINIETEKRRINARRTIKSCNWGKRLAGVNAIAPKNPAFIIPNTVRILIRSGLSPLIIPGIAMKYAESAILAKNRVVTKRMNEMVFGLPNDSVLPRSLKKFLKKK